MEIILKPQKATASLFNRLEKDGFIKILKPSQKALKTKTPTGIVDVFYTSQPRNGAHMLICVGKRNEVVEFSYHDDNEELLLIKPTKLKYKPLYLIIALHKVESFLKKVKAGTLKNADFKAIEVNFNDPETSFFTVLKGTVHAEVTAKGAGQHPVFFVTEPAQLEYKKIEIKNINFKVCAKW